MIDITKEKDIERVVIKHFEKAGWKRQKRGARGVDIRLWHPKFRKYWFIEVKREYTTKNKKSQTYVNTATGIGQIIYRMHQTQAGFYGLAVPNTKMFKDELRKIPLWIKKKLKLNLFLIDRNGKIVKITPSKRI